MESDESDGAVNGLEPHEIEAMEAFGEALGRAIAATIDYYQSNSIRHHEEMEKTFGQLAVAFATSQNLFE